MANEREHTRLLDNAREMINEGEAHYKKIFKEKYEQREKFMAGDHWYNVDLQDWQFPAVINRCRQFHDWYLSLLTDSPARLAVYGYSEDDYMPDPQTGYSPVDRISHLVKQKWDEMQMDNKYCTLMSMACQYGLAWAKVYVNAQKKWSFTLPDGTPQTINGDLDVAVISPKGQVLVDPGASWSSNPVDATLRSEFIIYKTLRSIRDIVATYPQAAEKIKGTSPPTAEQLEPWGYHQIDKVTGRPQEIAITDSAGATSWIIPSTESLYRYQAGNYRIVTEVWMRDPQSETGKIVVVLIDEQILQVMGTGLPGDQPYPYKHNEFPFICFTINPIPGKVDGYGMLDNIIPVQQLLNKRHGQLMDWFNMAKGPPFAYKEGSIDMDNVVIGPNTHLPYRGDTPPSWLNLPPVPNEVWTSINLYDRIMQELVGIGEAIQGTSVKAGASDIAIEGVVEQAMQRIRLADRYNEASRNELGRQILACMAQLYGNTGYETRMLGDKGSPQSLFVKPDDLMGRKDFQIITGVALDMKKQQWFKMSMDMRGGKPIMVPDDEVIHLSGLPNPEKIIEENKKYNDMQAQMQMLQQENEALKQQLGPAAAPPQPGPQGPPQGG